MKTNQNFALVDNYSGFVWWVGSAASPEAACAAATLETGGDAAEYESTYSLASNESGYYVYEAPAGFDVENGQDANAIAAVEAMKCLGAFSEI